jgi:tRNA splicing ligase
MRPAGPRPGPYLALMLRREPVANFRCLLTERDRLAVRLSRRMNHVASRRSPSKTLNAALPDVDVRPIEVSTRHLMGVVDSVLEQLVQCCQRHQAVVGEVGSDR